MDWTDRAPGGNAEVPPFQDLGEPALIRQSDVSRSRETASMTAAPMPEDRDPALELHELASREPLVRLVPYPWELVFEGFVRACPVCGASRDWLLINVGSDVWVRCRCAGQWHEPALARADIDSLGTYPERCWSQGLGQAAVSMGFDGLLAGVVWTR